MLWPTSQQCLSHRGDFPWLCSENLWDSVPLIAALLFLKHTDSRCRLGTPGREKPSLYIQRPVKLSGRTLQMAHTTSPFDDDICWHVQSGEWLLQANAFVPLPQAVVTALDAEGALSVHILLRQKRN